MLRQTRGVLIIIDLTQVQSLATANHSDAMQMTTREALPTLGRLEEYALFTYSFLVAPAETQILTVETILSYISQHIKNTSTFFYGFTLDRQHRRLVHHSKSPNPD